MTDRTPEFQSISAEALAREPSGYTLVDVRRRARYDEAAGVLPGARYGDPERVADWAAGLPKGKPVVVYCVHGYEISQGVAALLRGRGHEVRHLTGGYDDWVAAGRPIQAKDRQP
ncbi:MAG: sulfurtransferase [Alphaproteobacteria bacterium]|nr:sulfurtransferase [Alphaproteobacteria bacterium]